MSIASELQNLNDKILDAYDAVNDKGGTIPSAKNMANLSTAISSITTGGGGGSSDFDFSSFYNFTKSASGTFTVPSTTYSGYTITHNLGAIPVLVAFYADVESITKSDWGSNKILGGIAMQIGAVTGRGTSATVGANSFYIGYNAYTNSSGSGAGYGGVGAPSEVGATTNVHSFTTNYQGNGCVVNLATTTTAKLTGGTTNCRFMTGVTYKWVAIA